MLGSATYSEWTKVFNPTGSYFEGSWEQGSRMLFLGNDPETGKKGGMISRIAKNKLYEFISIEHRGEIHDGIEDTESERVKLWQGSFENYTFSDKSGDTELIVELIVPKDFKEFMDTTWPEALKVLKVMCES